MKNDSTLNCTIVNTPIYTCVCPLDKTSTNCVKTRLFTCEFKLVSPERKCENPNVYVVKVEPFFFCKQNISVIGGLPLDGDFPCLKFSMKDVVTFSATMNCKFSELPASQTVNSNIPRNQPLDIIQPVAAKGLTFDQVMSKFVYFVNTNSSSLDPTFALRNPIAIPTEFLAYNFYAFSDSRGSFPALATTPNHYIGKDVLNYSVKFSNLTDEFFAGDRLYAEIGYHKSVDQLVPQFERLFVDFTDRTPPPYVDNSTLIMAITIPIASVLFIAIAFISLIVYCCYQAQKTNEKQD